MQFQDSPDALNWALGTYINQQDNVLATYALMIFKRMCQFHFSMLSPEVVNQIRNILFNREYHQAHISQGTFKNRVTDAQVAFMWHVYPEPYGNFWDDLFSLDRSEIFEFIQSLCSYASILNGNDNLIYNKIKDAMRETGNDNRVASFVIELMREGNADAYKCFAHFSKWININYLLSQEGFQCIIDGFNSPQLCQYSLDIYIQLVTRGMPPEQKLSVINNINIREKIGFITSTENPPIELLISAARAINATGLELINEQPILEDYLNVALMFIRVENDDISEGVISLFHSTAKKYPQYHQFLLGELINRFETFFRVHSNEMISLDGFAEQLVMVIHSIVMSNVNAAMSQINSISQGNFYENLPKAAAIIHIVSNSLTYKDESHRQIISNFINIFAPIMQVPPPEIAPLHLYCISEFVKFFIPASPLFGPDIFAYIFNGLNGIIQNNEIMDVRMTISSLLKTFVEKLQNKIPFDPNQIYFYVQTCNPDLVSAAAILICNLREGQMEIFQQSLDRLKEFVANSENKFYAYEVILSFIHSIKYFDKAPHVQIIGPFIEQTFPEFFEIDPLLASCIRASYSSLGPFSRDLILRVIPQIKPMFKLSLTAVCSALMALVIDKADNRWICDFLPHISQLVLANFDSVVDWTAKTEENKETLDMICKYLKLITKLLKISPQCIVPQTYENLCQFTNKTFNNNFDIPILMMAIIDMLMQLIGNDLNTVVNFAPMTLSFLYSSKFDPLSNEWFDLCKRVMNFHIALLNKEKQNAVQLIAESFKRYGANDDLIRGYLAILESPRPRDRAANGRNFFFEFAKFRASLGN
ncbi:pre-tRNA nuclear export protein [Histomonas meleagridis]|uniref:pre-tRNA nuclear export protein n=1 Tax=Histomonas meleagridis TaxID=135588 RepID=UPI0035595D4B|nr:pre-tRNA nuclear export protein [Histomonas meleagridis]KAH0802320.1 pre-tRNA nuclear export protein [Histomonas meleagridis]